MKKVLKVLGILAVVLIVIPLIAGTIGEEAIDIVAGIYAVAILVLPFFLVGMLIRYLCRRKRHKAENRQPAAQEHAACAERLEQMEKPAVTITKTDRVPPQVPAKREHLNTSEGFDSGIAYHYSDVRIFVPYLDVLDRPDVVKGAVVTFRKEPENKFDSHAVAVVVGRKRIGYLYRGKLQNMANAWLDRGDTVSGRIVRCEPDAYKPKGNALSIDINFYSPVY